MTKKSITATDFIRTGPNDGSKTKKVSRGGTKSKTRKAK